MQRKKKKIKKVWDPSKENLFQYVDYDMQKNPHNVFSKLAPRNIPKPSEWNRTCVEKIKVKKKKKNKKEILIEKNKEKIFNNQIKSELEKLNNISEPLISDVRTPTGLFYKAIKSLEYYLENKNMEGIIDIWLSYKVHFDMYQEILDTVSKLKKKDKQKYKKEKKKLLSSDKILNLYYENKDLINRTKKVYNIGGNMIEYQLKKMGSRLVPLDFNSYYNKEFKLDKWQSKCLEYIDQKKSLLVCAPTSSGKTILTIYLTSKPGRILFVVPTFPLALQVGAMFFKHVEGNLWILAEELNYTFGNNPKIIVGTPSELCRNIEKLQIEEIQSLVIDEIHEMNNNKFMEILIHACMNQKTPTQFLGLSATIGNATIVKSWLSNFVQDIELVTVKDRFFNLQRFHYSEDNNSLSEISPCSTITNIENIHKLDLPFTPNDVYKLWESCNEYNIEMKPPLEYFDNSKRISLADIKEYSKYILERCSETNPEIIKKVFAQFSENIKDSEEKVDIYKLCTHLVSRNMVPSLIFNFDDIECQKLFDSLYNKLRILEDTKYPRYQKNLQKKNKKYRSDMEKYDNELEKINSDNKKKEYQETHRLPNKPDMEGSPHPDFVLDSKGKKIDPSDIEEIQEKICSEFAHRKMSDQIPKVIKLFSALLRGFAIYMKDLPAEYLRVVQSYAQQGLLTVIFSAKELACGVNFPFKNVVFCNDNEKLDTLIFQQGSGRSGRRGFDRYGSSVLAGIPKKKIYKLLNGELQPIISQNIVSSNIFCLPEITNKKEIINSMINKNMKSFVEGDKIKDVSDYISKVSVIPEIHHNLLWYLSRYPESEKICIFMEWFSDKKNILLHKRDSESNDYKIFALFAMILQVTTNQEECKIDINKEYENVEVLKSLLHHFNSKSEYKNLIDYDINNIDGNLYYTVKRNNISQEIIQNTKQFSLLKDKLYNCNDILLILRNYYKATTMELILRKVWRRLFWISKTVNL